MNSYKEKNAISYSLKLHLDVSEFLLVSHHLSFQLLIVTLYIENIVIVIITIILLSVSSIYYTALVLNCYI